MRNAGLEEAQTGIKIAGRNIHNLRYADDATLMAESKEELWNVLMKVKEESRKAGLELSIQKTKIMDGIWSHHFMGNRWGNNGNSGWLYFGELQTIQTTHTAQYQKTNNSLKKKNTWVETT